jgi:hypothetical protein
VIEVTGCGCEGTGFPEEEPGSGAPVVVPDPPEPDEVVEAVAFEVPAGSELKYPWTGLLSQPEAINATVRYTEKLPSDIFISDPCN